jgi:hypothetical protein
MVQSYNYFFVMGKILKNIFSKLMLLLPQLSEVVELKYYKTTNFTNRLLHIESLAIPLL